MAYQEKLSIFLRSYFGGRKVVVELELPQFKSLLGGLFRIVYVLGCRERS